MKKTFSVIGVVVVLAAVGVVGKINGWFNASNMTRAGQYVASYTGWARGGFQGSPTASLPDPAKEAAAKAQAAEQARRELAQLVAASKKRAVAKYPDLAVINAEINSRFVFRYNNLLKEHDPRLLEPNWPETLADECAVAMRALVKPIRGDKGLSVKNAVTSSKRMVASSVP